MITVLGAGPAGLTTARLLHLAGIECRVLERDPGPGARTQGGSLDLTGDAGLRAIAAAGLTTEFARRARPQGQSFRVLDEHATVHLDLGADDFDDERPEIDRVDLRSMLLSSLPPGTVHWGVDVRTVTPTAAGFTLGCGDGTTVAADVVVAADGIGSPARALRTDARPVYSGITFVQGEIRRPDPTSAIARLTGEGAMFALGDDRAIMAQRSGDGSIRTYFAARLPEVGHRGDDLGPDVGAVLHRRYAAFAPELTAAVDAVDTWSSWPLHSVPAVQRWNTLPGLTLIGDAAHVMPPFTGHGVNMALLDAVELVDALVARGDAPTAFADYERGMLARMVDEVVAANEAGDEMLDPGGPARLLARITGGAADPGAATAGG